MKYTSEIAEVFANNRDRLIRNNLLLVSGLNFLTLLIFIIGMSVPQWFYFQFDNSGSETGVWVNLLFVYDKSDYLPFHKAVTIYCRSPHDTCSTHFEQLSFIGTFVFCIFIAGNLLQLYDLVRVLMKAVRHSTFTSSNKFRHFLTIGTFLLGLSVYVFSTLVIDGITTSHFGACFYIALGSLLLLILTLIYERESMRRMVKQQMLIKLLEDQKYIEQVQMEAEGSRYSGDQFVM